MTIYTALTHTPNIQYSSHLDDSLAHCLFYIFTVIPTKRYNLILTNRINHAFKLDHLRLLVNIKYATQTHTQIKINVVKSFKIHHFE